MHLDDKKVNLEITLTLLPEPTVRTTPQMS